VTSPLVISDSVTRRQPYIRRTLGVHTCAVLVENERTTACQSQNTDTRQLTTCERKTDSTNTGSWTERERVWPVVEGFMIERTQVLAITSVTYDFSHHAWLHQLAVNNNALGRWWGNKTGRYREIGPLGTEGVSLAWANTKVCRVALGQLLTSRRTHQSYHSEGFLIKFNWRERDLGQVDYR